MKIKIVSILSLAILLACERSEKKDVKSLNEKVENKTMAKQEKFMLSEKEKEALEKDKKLLDAAKKFNSNYSDTTTKGLFPNAQSIPPMIYWAKDGYLARAKLKQELNHGAEINKGYAFRDYKGYTALHEAASRGHMDTVKFLIENGAKASIKLASPPYSTPAELARNNKHTEVANYLSEAEKKESSK